MSEQDLEAATLDAWSSAAEAATSAILDAMALSCAYRGDTERLRSTLQGGADIRAADWDGRTLVFLAARGGHTETVRALAARGADVSAADVRGATPVFIAAQNGHTETVRALAACGAACGAPDDSEYIPVVAAAYGGHTACVLALVHECGVDANTRSIHGMTPVLAASFKGHTGTVRALVRECAADLNTANIAGMTPVYAAAIGGHLETLQTLVREFGADANTASERGFTPLSTAASRGDAAMAWTLVREGGAELHRARAQRLAFAMALHPRLGGGSRAYALDDLLLNMVLGPHVASGPAASEMAARRGHARTARVLKFLEEHDGLAPVHAAANAARRAGFECPVCLESAGGALALAPCGHQVCRGCWAQIQSRGKRCPLCRDLDPLAVDPGTFPAWAPLHQRFCVQVPDELSS
jgi:ankyrin repeat protein